MGGLTIHENTSGASLRVMTMSDAERAERAFRDVLAVEWDDETGAARIVTLGGSYLAVPELGQHNCPDREYHDVARCKHLLALDVTRGKIDAPEAWLTVEDLDERTEPTFDIERPPRIGKNHTFGAFTDGGECPDCAELPDGWPCAECSIEGGKEITEDSNA